MEKDFDYYAFISYNREDEKWAKWLQNKLENYKLPAVIRKENADLPKEIRPIFRDKTGMEAGVIVDTVQEKLKRSQYLIVICSPKAAQSNWVGTEINAFIEMGRSNRIIPFIVDGVPNSNDSRECFHPHIKEKIPEPLGINIKEIGKQEAFVKTAAKLLNLRFEALWDRFRIARRKQRLIAAAIGLLFLAGLGWIYNYFYPPKEYYADYVDKKGIPEGIIKLTKAQVKKRNAHYRFEKSKRKLRRVVYANSAGTPVEHKHIEYADRPSILEIKYDEDNSLSKTILKNAKRKTIAAYSWDKNDYNTIYIRTDEFRESDALLDTSYMSNYYKAAEVIRVASITKPGRPNAVIKRFNLTRDDKDYIIRREFKRSNDDYDDVGASNVDGVWGFKYDIDKLGRPEKIWYLGPNGENSPDKNGVMGKEYEYDRYGNIHIVTYFGEDEKPVVNEMSWSTAIFEADDTNENITSEYYLDDYGEPCSSILGYAKINYKYDDARGNITKVAFFDLDGKLTGRYETWEALIRYEYDKQGNIKREAAFDDGGNQLYNHKYEYNRQGNIIEKIYFDNDGNPDMKTTYKYEQGNIIEENYSYYDGNPGFKTIYKYEQGNKTEEIFYYSDGRKDIFKFDEQGNMTEDTYFDIDGRFRLHEYGYSKGTYFYNRQGNTTDEAFFDTDGNLCLNKFWGFAKAEFKYNEQGYETEVVYFDTKGNIIMYAYNDAEGNIKEFSYFDDDGNKIIKKYDERGNETEETYFDVAGNEIKIN